MKTRILLFILILFGSAAFLFTACDLSGSSNYTPEMAIYPGHATKADTVNLYITDEGGVLRMDTINVGDTIVFRLYLNAHTNNLTSFYVTQADTSEARILYPVITSMDSIFSRQASDYEKGKFIFQPKKSFVYFPLRYVPLRPSNTASIQFSLTSDANFESGIGANSVTIKIKTPVLPAPVVIMYD